MINSMCFTGHRPKELFGYDESARPKYSELTQEILKIIRGLYDDGCRTFISGGAQGVDQIAFWAVEHLKKEHPDVKNVLYAPFKNQESSWKEKGMFGQAEYRKMLKAADKVSYVFESRRSNYMLMVRNHIMVNDSDVVLAIYGRPEDFRTIEKGSGTAECMQYAYKNNKDIIILNPFTHLYRRIST